MPGFESACKAEADGVLLKLRVHPGAGRTGFGELYGDSVKLSLQAPPVDGKANAALLKFLADKCNVPKNGVELRTGASGREKRIFIRGISLPQLIKILEGK